MGVIVLVRDFQFVAAVDHIGFETVELHDFGIAVAITEILLGNTPKGVAVNNGVDAVGFFNLHRTGYNLKVVDCCPGVNTGNNLATGLLDLLAEQNAILSTFNNRLTLVGGLRFRTLFKRAME